MSLYATLPFWPLLGAILVGLLIAFRAKASVAHWPVVLGVLVSAVLAVMLFFDLPGMLLREASEESPQAVTDVAEADREAGSPAPEFVDHGITYPVYDWISYGQEQSLNAERNQWISVNSRGFLRDTTCLPKQ